MRRRMMIGQGEEDVREWKLIWDSGVIEEEMHRTDDVDVSGYAELMVFAKVVPVASNPASTRYGAVEVIDDDGRRHQLLVGTLFVQNGNSRLSKVRIEKVDNLIVSQSSTSWNGGEIFEGGWGCDNLNEMRDSIVTANSMQRVFVSNQNVNNEYLFGTGSRFRIYAR